MSLLRQREMGVDARGKVCEAFSRLDARRCCGGCRCRRGFADAAALGEVRAAGEEVGEGAGGVGGGFVAVVVVVAGVGVGVRGGEVVALFC